MRRGGVLAIAVGATLQLGLLPPTASASHGGTGGGAVLTRPVISSGGDQARHLCSVGAPCTSEYAPLNLSLDDRVDVDVPVTATAVRLIDSRSGSVPGQSRSCARSVAGSWVCRPPAGSSGARSLGISIDYSNGRAGWSFDVRMLPRGVRATARPERIRFRLAGRHLRIQVLPQADGSPSSATDSLWGNRVTAACFGRRWNATRPREHARIAKARWPEGRTTFGFLFKRPLREAVRFCLIEGPTGGDVALVRFPRR